MWFYLFIIKERLLEVFIFEWTLTSKKAELERLNDAQSVAKIEKAIGKVERKILIRALRLFQLNFSVIEMKILFFINFKKFDWNFFRKINENLQKHLENLDALEKSKLPPNLVRKCKDFSKLLLETTAKVDKVLNKLDKWNMIVFAHLRINEIQHNKYIYIFFYWLGSTKIVQLGPSPNLKPKP